MAFVVVDEAGAPPAPGSDCLARHAATGVIAVLDGRIDDRDALALLHAPHLASLPAPHTDASLALVAYLHSPLDLARRLVGDYALLIWDPGSQRVTCVRDALGVKPLFYCATDSLLIAATNLRTVLAHPAVPRQPNLGMLGEYLTFNIRSRVETLYASVSRVAPGHSLVVDRRSVRQHCDWQLTGGQRIRYRDGRQYEDHFRDLVGTAVADRLPKGDRVGVALSGGLDSSAIVGMSAEILNSAKAADRLHTYSLTFPGTPTDETQFINAANDHWQLRGNLIPWDGFTATAWRDQARTALDLPDHPTGTALTRLYARAHRDGIRVLLTGEGGDLWHDGTIFPHRHLLGPRRLPRLVAELRDEARYSGLMIALRLMATSLLWPLVPARVRSLVESRRQAPLPAYLSPGFAKMIGLRARLHEGDCAGRFDDAAIWRTAKIGFGGLLLHFYEAMTRMACSQGVELRHPLMDRRLIEFSMAIPDPLKRRGPVNRLLMRDTLSDLYPPLIAGRLSKANFGDLQREALLTPEVRDVLCSGALRNRDWIDPDEAPRFIRETLSACESGADQGALQFHRLWMLFACETWYRTLGGSKGAAD